MDYPKVALVGAGYWGKNLLRNLYELSVLDTLVDTDPHVLEKAQIDYPNIKTSRAFSQVLNDPNIGAIFIATPAETHATLVRESLLSGKHCFVEKPLCLSEKEGMELVDIANNKGLILMVGHLLWYHPAILKLKEMIDSGELGRIRYIYSNRLNMGKLRREENVLWSFAPHDVSIILGLLQEMPESVQAQGGNYLHQHISDVTVSLLSFKSGVKAHIFVSWLHPFKEQKLVIVGEEKMAVFDDTLPWEKKLSIYPHHVKWQGMIPLAIKANQEFIPLEAKEPLKEECKHFLDCIKHKRQPRTDGFEGVKVLHILNACQKALEEGHSIRIQSLDSIYNSPFIHPTSVIDDDVRIGVGTKVWHFSHILKGSKVGENCNIGQNVVIGPNVSIGDGCKIQNNVSVYEGVTLEDYVFCGPSVVFTNVYNPRAHIPRMKELRKTLVKKGATLGANCTIICGVTIGKYAFVGAGAVVTKDVPDYALVVGNPARQIGWMCECGNRLGEDFICPVCGKSYNKKELMKINL